MKRYLILENGMTFEGEAFGGSGDVIAEIVFTTAMVGYVETLTDESYAGQAVCQTFPLIGNYGVNENDTESDSIGVKAYIVREYAKVPSNFRCEMDIDTFLKKYNIPGLYGIDTRRLTKVLREYGTMNGMITDDVSHYDAEAVKAYRIIDPVSAVTTKEKYIVNEGGDKKIALMDFGRKVSIVNSLAERNCEVHVFPAHATAEEILVINPDGVFYTNGPGDPSDNKDIINTIKELIPHKIPTMGICLGHQLLALANGFETSKLKYGHRGANHPVKCTENGRVFITSQNHGYAVVNETINPDIAAPLFMNVNDGTNEGLIYRNAPAFSVQFHPEAHGGPHDTDFLFDRFLGMINK